MEKCTTKSRPMRERNLNSLIRVPRPSFRPYGGDILLHLCFHLLEIGRFLLRLPPRPADRDRRHVAMTAPATSSRRRPTLGKMTSGRANRLTMFMTLMSGLIAGPAVSFKRVAHRVASDRCLVLVRMLAALIGARFVLDHLLGVVPRAAGVRHEHGQELAAQDHARQETAQSEGAQEEAHNERRTDSQQPGADQLLLRGTVQMATTRA